MRPTSEEASRFAKAPAIATYPFTNIEVLGYVTQNAENYAMIRRGNRMYKAFIRYNGYEEAYCVLSINGKHQRVYLNDCRRCIH